MIQSESIQRYRIPNWRVTSIASWKFVGKSAWLMEFFLESMLSFNVSDIDSPHRCDNAIYRLSLIVCFSRRHMDQFFELPTPTSITLVGNLELCPGLQRCRGLLSQSCSQRRNNSNRASLLLPGSLGKPIWTGYQGCSSPDYMFSVHSRAVWIL